MLLSPGRRLGPYEVLATLGAGGMGEVYRARDTRLGREVALKTLPAAFAEDPDRLGRFDREAQLLAALNHPNIAVLYGSEEQDGARFLVLELIEGETLADRLLGGPLGVFAALPVFLQIAEALEAAHEKGIVHRDLKPANVKITPGGKVKVLDFGLAKALSAEPSDANLLQSATLAQATVSGVILGTAPYMSPEQARGKPLDKRTDIWSFGCVLYESLSGRRPFEGETVSDTLAAILGQDPDWSALPAATPSRIRALLRRCLQKDLPRRVRDIGDVRLEIEEVLSESATGLLSTASSRRVLPKRSLVRAVAWGLGGLALAASVAGATAWIRSRPGPAPPATVARFTLSLPVSDTLAYPNQPSLAFSPDGKRLVFGAHRGGKRQLFMRELDRLEAAPIPGTFGGEGPFFSPDGRWLGFFAAGKLKKLPLLGGTPVEVCDAPEPRGASWSEDGDIIVARERSEGLSRVGADGKPRPLTDPAQDGGRSHRWPEVLPGGRAVLFTVWSGGFDDARIAVQSLRTGQRQTLLEGASAARYLATGHLAYVRWGTLYAVPFDPDRLELQGAPSSVLEGVSVNPDTGAAHLALSPTGALVYAPGLAKPDDERTLLWVDRKGSAEPVLESRRAYGQPQLSPDGRSIAVGVEGGDHHLWTYEKGRGTLTRLTFEQAWDTAPLWTPDGSRVAFSSDRGGRPNVFWKAADGGRPEERLTTSEHRQFPECWTRDGRTLIFSDEDPVTGWDLWTLTLGATPQPLLRTPADEREAVLSPDGRWLAYQSNESGRYEVYVRPFPGPGGQWQVSSEGAAFPMWARDGRELFYRSGEKMVAVAVKPGASFQAEQPRTLFEGPYQGEFDVGPDGRFILVRGREPEPTVRQLVVVLGWLEELKRHRP